MFDHTDDTDDLPPSANYVYDELDDADRPLTQREITSGTHYARNTVSIALGELTDRGLVTTVSTNDTDHTGRPPERYVLIDE